MSVKFVPAVTRTITDVPAKVVIELTVEQAARYHALLGRSTFDFVLYQALAEAIPQEAHLRCTGVQPVAQQDLPARY